MTCIGSCRWLFVARLALVTASEAPHASELIWEKLQRAEKEVKYQVPVASKALLQMRVLVALFNSLPMLGAGERRVLELDIPLRTKRLESR